jgi:hypothetical protein
MIGVFSNPSPPMAENTVLGKFGGFLQVVAGELRSMISQVSMKTPPHMSSLEKP